MFCQSQFFFLERGSLTKAMTASLQKKIVQEGDEVTKSPKEATLVITGQSSVKDEGEKLFELTKSFLKKYPNQNIACCVLYHHWISDCLKNGKLMNKNEHNAPFVSKNTVQAVCNITLISQKQTKAKSCEFVRTFSNISEFAN